MICQQGMTFMAFTYPWVGRHQGVRSERRGPIGWEGLSLGDEGVVALVVDSRVYESAVHAPGAVPCGNKRQVRGGLAHVHSSAPPAPLATGKTPRQQAEHSPVHPTRP